MVNEKILRLSYYLRNDGVNVSIRSTMMASQIWDEFNEYFDNNHMKEALKSVHVKNKRDLAKFERAYNYVFIYNKDTSTTLEKDHKQVDNNSNNNKEDQSKSNKKNKPEKDTTRETILKRRLKQKEVVDKSILDDEFIKLDTIDYRVFDICYDFSKKIANHRSIRKKSSRSRGVDMPKTIRKNLKNGGHLINLVGKTPPEHKSKHIFLCDISGSCEWSTSWFFSLLTGCYKSFYDLTLYLFDNRTIDVTHALDTTYKNTYQVNVGIQSLGLRPRGHSDMTKSFNEFLKKADINKNTDVILLTDCRDWTGRRIDGVLESATVLHRIVNKSRRVIILNPENKVRWNSPTSCVSDYQEAGATVYQTTTLREFASIVETL
ncbi:MAG: VWA domain-containing protein [Methanosphaera sp.]|nr:VWA domain-containing protein [Methanosphaera sp.]